MLHYVINDIEFEHKLVRNDEPDDTIDWYYEHPELQSFPRCSTTRPSARYW
jgi:hypothetical protein